MPESILFDDIGSYPPPDGESAEWIRKAFGELNDTGTRQKLYGIIGDAMRQKIKAGVKVPTYPQFQEMNDQFLNIITKEEGQEPFIVKEERAKIIELEAIEQVAKEHYDLTGERLKVRICVTGPVELHQKQLGSTVFSDILKNLAISVDRFIKNSIDGAKNFDIFTVSIDEPSIGINPELKVEENELINAIELASEYAYKRGIDVEMHLHSSIWYKTMCQVNGVSVIGLESAANPSYLNLIEKKDLEDTDKFLRVGVSRTDISKMAADYDEKNKIDVWKDKKEIDKMISASESPEMIKKRLQKAQKIFGDRIKYAGPDCGLGSWPSQRAAFILLKNTGSGILKGIQG